MDANQQTHRSALSMMARGLAGAAAGGALGYFAFVWIAHQGFYAVALPGTLLGMGASLFARERSLSLSILCGVLALGLGLFSEWNMFPLAADPSLGYFLGHLQDLRPLSWIMLLLGGAAGAYFAWRSGVRVATPTSTVPPA